MSITIRTIQASDNAALAKIIRTSLEEFNANKPGTVYFDNSTDKLFETFITTPNSIYFVVEQDGKILGGGGIFPTADLPEKTCELVKMYLTKSARGLGFGRMLIERCMDAAKQLGYEKIYLETMPELIQAVKLYQLYGFQYINHSLGNSGHCGCGIWMLKEL
jgi:putative acetyltransferase